MNEILQLLAQNALLFGLGITVLLSLGCGAVMLCKSPVHRQRISELAIAGVLGWMVLALFPLPRLLPDNLWAAKTQTRATDTLPVTGAHDAERTGENSPTILAPIAEVPIRDPILLPDVSEF